MQKFVFSFVCLCLFIGTINAEGLAESYISEWKKFYPSKAERSGMHDAIFNYEDFNQQNIRNWLNFNKQALQAIAEDGAEIDRIDARLLRVQAQSEVDTYETLAQHRHSLRFYSTLIANAIPSISNADYLLAYEKPSLYCDRLASIVDLSVAASTNLTEVSKQDLEAGLNDLLAVQNLLANEIDEADSGVTLADCVEEKDLATQRLEQLILYAKELMADAKASELVLGKAEYIRQLQLYTDSDLTAEKLAEMALAEIATVKDIMAEVSREYLADTYPDMTSTMSDLEAINRALADMEKDVPLSSSDYLQFWQQLADDSVAFIEQNDLVTLPEVNTLRIQNAPESAGPAARIGWVASAPPFHPNPVTTLNLPSIPESFPEQEQIDFWSSFNKPFNRMIVIHELYPGHYTQLKISRKTPHHIRLLFPYGTYIEGWATLTEKVLLDAGWQKDDPLTLLAHLRKRLENANRAYISVQVHTNDWTEEQVLKFSTETSLVAPQFAKSLMGRISRSPMQMTSYFLGREEFAQLLAYEEQRLGEQFNLKFFMDTIIKAGPIPIDEFYAIFEQSAKSE